MQTSYISIRYDDDDNFFYAEIYAEYAQHSVFEQNAAHTPPRRKVAHVANPSNLLHDQ